MHRTLVGEFPPQDLGRVDLDDDAPLEVGAGAEAQVLVRRPGVAVGARVLAAAVRVEAPAVRNVGRAFDKPLSQWKDVVKVTRTLLSGRKLTEADAKLVEYRPFALEMKPVRADVPIYVAALKEKSIESIGEVADGWMPTFWPYQELKSGHEWIARGAAKAGRNPADIITAPFTTVLPMPGDFGKQKAKEIVAFYIGGMV